MSTIAAGSACSQDSARLTCYHRLCNNEKMGNVDRIDNYIRDDIDCLRNRNGVELLANDGDNGEVEEIIKH